ncbi:hypothetical protein [Mycoplasma mycoides]|uniref:hypothetical protein n=1 Tax=Mycoplasma mycoides TaxID=2102 RepID=UPI0022404921|nr:hypothetical protein [Mycoplasma mycoides]
MSEIFKILFKFFSSFSSSIFLLLLASIVSLALAISFLVLSISLAKSSFFFLSSANLSLLSVINLFVLAISSFLVKISFSNFSFSFLAFSSSSFSLSKCCLFTFSLASFSLLASTNSLFNFSISASNVEVESFPSFLTLASSSFFSFKVFSSW